MVFKDIQEWDCPFCEKGKILVVIFPSSVRFKKGPWGGYKGTPIKTRERGYIQSKECPECHKTSEEIQQKWKEQGIVFD